MGSYGFYFAIILVYGAVDSMACLGLNLEFGVAGISNFGFIIFQSMGAYTAAVLFDAQCQDHQWGLPAIRTWLAPAVAVAVDRCDHRGRSLGHTLRLLGRQAASG